MNVSYDAIDIIILSLGALSGPLFLRNEIFSIKKMVVSFLLGIIAVIAAITIYTTSEGMIDYLLFKKIGSSSPRMLLICGYLLIIWALTFFVMSFVCPQKISHKNSKIEQKEDI